MKEIEVEEKEIKKEELLKEFEEEIINELRRIRKEKHYTQKELAEEAHIIRETVAKIETKIVSPQINTMIKILYPLGYTLRIEKISKKRKK